MENAADALKMAGAVLIFVLALSIIILSFGQVRETSDTILNYKDRETTYEYYEPSEGLVRTVGMETIIPSVFRACLENYKIVFEGLDTPLYKIERGASTIDRNTIDLEQNFGKQDENSGIGNNDDKVEFLCGILYHDFKNNDKNAFQRKFNISLPDNCLSLYDQLKNANKITELLGVYYQDDEISNNDGNGDNINDDEQTLDDVNKTLKRVITYKIEK